MSSILGDLESKVLHSKPLDKSINLKEQGKKEVEYNNKIYIFYNI